MEGQTPSLEEIKQQCIFCQIISGSVASKKVFEDDKVFAVLDINPANPGHILVLSKEHYSIMPQIPETEIEHLGRISKALSHSSISALKAQGTTVFIANGVAAGQKAQHFMMHVIPRMEGDGVSIDFPEKQLKPEDMEKVYDAVIKGVEKVFGTIPEGVKKIKKEEVEKDTEEEPKKKEAEKKQLRTKKAEKPSKKQENVGLDDIAKLLTGR